MPLDKMLLPVAVQGGLAQDREDVALGLGEGFVLVENLVYDRAGALKKRGGYVPFGALEFRDGDPVPTTKARSLHSHRGALVAMFDPADGTLPEAASYTNAGWARHAAAVPCSSKKTPAVRSTIQGISNAQAVRVNGYDVITFIVGKKLLCKVVEVATGVVVQDERILLPNYVLGQRLIEVNNEAVVVYRYDSSSLVTGGVVELRAMRLFPWSFNFNGPEVTIYTGAVRGQFDAVFDGVNANDFWVSWVPVVGGGVSVRKGTLTAPNTITFGGALTHAAPDASGCSMVQHGSGQIWVTFHEFVNNTAKLARWTSAPFAFAGVTVLDAAAGGLKRTACTEGGWCFWEGDNTAGGGGQGVFYSLLDSTGAVVTFASIGRVFWAHLASRGWTRRGHDWILLRDTKTRGYALLWPDQIAATPLTGSYHGAVCLADCIDSDPSATYPLASVERYEGEQDRWRWIAPVQAGIATVGSLSPRGRQAADFVDFDFRVDQAPLSSSCEAAGSMIVGGTCPGLFDGQQATELGFLRPPFVISHIMTSGVGGGAIEGADIAPGVHNRYLYRLVYEWQDQRGAWHVSEPSEPYAITVSAAQTLAKIDFKIATLVLTRKGDLTWLSGRMARIGVYRTLKNAPEIYYRVNDPNLPDLANDRANAYVQFADTLSDAQLLAQGFGSLYTEGGALEHLVAPSAQVVCTWQNRVWIASGEYPGQLCYSKELLPGQGAAFHLVSLSLLLEEEISGLAPLGASLLIFSRRRTYTLSGVGPTDTGAQSDLWRGPSVLSESVGCIDSRSIVQFPGGVAFLSEQGFHVIAAGAAPPQLIGAPVLQMTRDFPTLRGAGHDGTRGRLYWTMQAPNGAAIVLVYDYLRAVWYVWTIAGASSSRFPLASTVHDAKHTFGSGLGLFEQGGTLDGAEYIPWRLVLPWLRLEGLLGFERFYRVMLALKRASGVELVVRLRYDEESSVDQEQVLLLSALTSPLSGRLALEVHARRQKCRSVQIELAEQLAVSGAESGTVELYGIEVQVGRKRGAPKLPLANRR